MGDLQHRKKKKRGFAWFYLMSGLMKVHSAFTCPSTTAHIAGWSYVMQAITMATEAFWHKSLHEVNHPEKVIGSNVFFCIAMFIWTQVSAFQHRQRHAALPQAPASIG